METFLQSARISGINHYAQSVGLVLRVGYPRSASMVPGDMRASVLLYSFPATRASLFCFIRSRQRAHPRSASFVPGGMYAGTRSAHPFANWWAEHFLRSAGRPQSARIAGLRRKPTRKKAALADFFRRVEKPRSGFSTQAACTPGTRSAHPFANWWVEHFLRSAGRPQSARIAGLRNTHADKSRETDFICRVEKPRSGFSTQL